MRASIMQPYLFPYIGYWQLINSSEVFVIYDDVNYIKQGYINRNSIINGSQAQRFTLEVLGASPNKLINETQVGNNRKKILKGFEQNYKKAPEFNTCFPLIKEIIEHPEQNLARFIGNSIAQISNFLSIKTKIIYSSEIIKNDDLRAQEKVVDICHQLNASQYINPIGGKDLYSKSHFNDAGIQLLFLEPVITPYKQFNDDFIPNLSIIDIMMFSAKEELHNILKNYTLI